MATFTLVTDIQVGWEDSYKEAVEQQKRDKAIQDYWRHYRRPSDVEAIVHYMQHKKDRP